jgi:Family of unknown function (DUF6011)
MVQYSRPQFATDRTGGQDMSTETVEVIPPSQPQVKYVNDLLDVIAGMDTEIAAQQRALIRHQYEARTLTKRSIGRVIDALKKLKTELAEEQYKKSLLYIPQVPVGRYAVDTAAGPLGFYRVAISKNDYYAVYVYASDEQHKIENWGVAKAILFKIEKAGIEQARTTFGAEMKSCWKCGRKLTDETSRSLGIGPECRAKD